MGRISNFVESVQRNTRYLDEFVFLKCATDMLRNEVFPNAKEISESFGAYQAVRKFGRPLGFDLGDADTVLVAVGDGSSPRTGATFAYRSLWQCVSIDPNLGRYAKEHDIMRLKILDKKVENVKLEPAKKAVIVCTHSHAPIKASIECIDAEEKLVVTMPCCVDQSIRHGIGWSKVADYRDPCILSPHDRIEVWYQGRVEV